MSRPIPWRVYTPGDAVTIDLLLNGGLMGPASFSPTWDSRGASPGSCHADVTIVAPSGAVLGRARYLFELNASQE